MTPPAGGGGAVARPARSGGEVRRQLTIVNQRGLHARAAAQFCKLAGSFKRADIKVVRNDVTVSGCSIMGLMMLAAGPGMTIEIVARGADAEAAVEALAKLVADGFGEED
jgi:phosphocarrier protein